MPLGPVGLRHGGYLYWQPCRLRGVRGISQTTLLRYREGREFHSGDSSG